MLIFSWLATIAAICFGCLGATMHYYRQGDIEPEEVRALVSLAYLAVFAGFISAIIGTVRSVRLESWRSLAESWRSLAWLAFPLLVNSGAVAFLLWTLYSGS
jgi:hypothetical protein